MRYLAFVLSLISLSACIPRTTVVHDGMTASVIDAETKQPLAAAFVYDRIENSQPHILAKSDSLGQIQLEPNTRLTLTFPLGEALVFQSLWVCKEGYKPFLAGQRSGWNADYAPAKYFELHTIELTRSLVGQNESCLETKW